MTPEQIKALVIKGESETLEFKLSTGRRSDAMKTVCAMLNQRGGHVLFGVSPEGEIEGQQVSDRTIEQLSSEIQNIESEVFPSIERVRIKGDREVVVISVKPGTSKPYAYKGTEYRRVGNTTVKMSRWEVRQMLLEEAHEKYRWEKLPAEEWSIEDLDADEIRITVQEAIRQKRLTAPVSMKIPDLLRGLELVGQNDELLQAAVVLFGKEELIARRMPQCLLCVARFRGFDKMEFLDNRQFKGNAFKLLEDAERFLRDTLPIAGRFEPGRFARIDEPLYPHEATREAIINALCHRDYIIAGSSVDLAVYDDRMEVVSPGPLHFELTPEDLFSPHKSQPWNPLIANTFYRRGIIEKWGTGTIKMAEIMESARLPRPEIEDNGRDVTVKFHLHLNDSVKRQEMVLTLLRRSRNGLTLRNIHTRMSSNFSERQVRRTLEKLRDDGLVVCTGTGPLAMWKRTQNR